MAKVWKTKLKAKAELDALPEADRDSYEEQSDGSYVLATEPVDGYVLENVDGLRSALSSERAAKKAAEERARAFEGLDPKETRSLKKKLDEMQADYTPGEKVAELLNSRERQIRDEMKAALDAAAQTNGSYEKEIERLLIESEATRILAGKDGKPVGSAKLLMPHIKAATRVEKANGKFVRKVIGEDGNPLVTRRTGQHGDMDLEEFVLDVMRKDPELGKSFYGAPASGSGSGQPGNQQPPTQTKNGQVRVISDEELTSGQISLEELADGRAVLQSAQQQ